MELMKVIILGIVICFLSVLLKQIKPEYSVITIIVGGIILVLYIVNSLIDIFGFFSNVVGKTGIDGDLFLLLVKIIGIGYLILSPIDVCPLSLHIPTANSIK